MNRDMSNEPRSRMAQMHAARHLRPVEIGPARPRRPYDLWAALIALVSAWTVLGYAVGQRMGWWS